jgi:hypothetical protein
MGQRHDGRQGLRPSAREGQWLHDSRREHHPATAGQEIRLLRLRGVQAGAVKVCTFDGPHTPSSVDDGTSTGDDGLKAFIPPLAWQFIAQF